MNSQARPPAEREPCADYAADLLAGFRGELPEPRMEQVRRHLDVCRECRDESEGMRSMQSLLDRIPVVTPAADSWTRMQARIRSAEITENNEARPSGLFRLPLVAAAVAAAAVILVLVLPELIPASGRDPDLCLGSRAHGHLFVDGSPLDEGPEEFTGRTIRADGLSRLRISGVRAMDLTFAPGTRLRVEDPYTFRLLSGRILAEVHLLTGPKGVEFPFPGGTVEVTGTTFDLTVDGDRAVLAVLEGEVLLRTGDTPVRVDSGTSITIPRGGPAGAPVEADPWRVRDWCSAPTPSLTHLDGRLTFTLANATAAPITLKTFDPGAAIYSLQIEGKPPRRILEGMVMEGGREPGETAFRRLEPGESYRIVLDTSAVGLTPGTYRVSAVYRPYGDLPAESWRGNLVSQPCVLKVE